MTINDTLSDYSQSSWPIYTRQYKISHVSYQEEKTTQTHAIKIKDIQEQPLSEKELVYVAWLKNPANPDNALRQGKAVIDEMFRKFILTLENNEKVPVAANVVRFYKIVVDGYLFRTISPDGNEIGFARYACKEQFEKEFSVV
jgi:hypothetical protein